MQIICKLEVKMKKKIISGVLAAIASIMLIGCGSSSNTNTTNEENKDKG